MKNFLVIAAMVAGASVASTPKSADAALILPAVATQAHSDVVSVQYRRRRTVVRIYRPRPQPRYYGPGSGSGVGRLIENGPGSGTGRGRF